MRRLLLVSVAIVLLLVGAVVLPMPIPFGAIMMLAGLAILIHQSPFVARQVQSFRRHHLPFDQAVRRVEVRLPGWLRDIVRRTNP